MTKERPDWVEEMMQEQAFLRKELGVTEADYRDAVESLLQLAVGDTGGSRAAAQLLLSLYNGNRFHMDMTDLCVLDLQYFQQALIAIRGRVVLNHGPHSMITNGSERFEALADQWAHYSTKQRYVTGRGSEEEGS
ncbi:MAG: hypothetical protein AAGF57_04660 [Pseudomonadota bacterium]